MPDKPARKIDGVTQTIHLLTAAVAIVAVMLLLVYTGAPHS